MPKTILVVEDDADLADGLKLNLEMDGYRVQIAKDGPEALSVYDRSPIDLILLDVMLPGQSGFDVCRRIREAAGRVPILFLTARDAQTDRELGLEAGGDDYITKPFSLKELALRIKAMFRRQAWFATTETGERYLRFGNCTMDLKTFEGQGPRGSVRLSRKECMVLKFLFEHHGEIVSRDMLLDGVWGYDIYPSSRTIDNFILRLRKQFEEDPKTPRHFLSVYGSGYRFEPGEPVE